MRNTRSVIISRGGGSFLGGLVFLLGCSRSWLKLGVPIVIITLVILVIIHRPASAFALVVRRQESLIVLPTVCYECPPYTAFVVVKFSMSHVAVIMAKTCIIELVAHSLSRLGVGWVDS